MSPLFRAVREWADHPSGIGEAICVAAAQPNPWPDPSDAWTFAAHPTARYDSQELASAQLRGLVALGFESGALRLDVLGAPVARHLELTQDGWCARWPFC